MVEPGGYGRGYNVRVSFSRGRFRVVVGPSSAVSGGRRVVVVVVLVDVPELEVSVLEVLEVVVSSPGLMSVVTGGLVLVMISVVEVADDEYVDRTRPAWLVDEVLRGLLRLVVLLGHVRRQQEQDADHDQTHDAGADHGRRALVPRPPVGVVVAVAGHGH